MPTPSTGPIGFNDLNIELGVPATTLRSLNDAAVRTLAGTPFATPGTTISLNDLRGKSNAFTATGGTVIDSGGFRIHVFTSPGSFVVSNVTPTVNTVEYLVVAGGGGGGLGIGGGGGGGAGGFRTATGFPVTATSYPITVGGGGVGGTQPTPANPDLQFGVNGNPSIFSTITSTGGGGGSGTWLPGPGRPGGSGGAGNYGGGTGGAGNTPPTTPPQGNPGGSPTVADVSAGGGGAGAAGSPAPPSQSSGPGGIGSPISWLPASYGTPGPAPGRYFAGGGGGGQEFFIPGTGGAGGAGGGGRGGYGPGPVTPDRLGVPGTTNTGGGGGGGSGQPPYVGGSGGSGIVAIRYVYP
jgi:hypothetical protein